MILKILSEYAQSSKDILCDEKKAFVLRSVHYIIDLDSNGNIIGVIIASKDRKYHCPRSFRKKIVGGVSGFLVDNVTAVFGIDMSKNTITDKQLEKRQQNNLKKFNDFWKQIDDCYQHTQCSNLLSLIKFKQNYQVEFGNYPNIISFGDKKIDQTSQSDDPPLQVHSPQKPCFWISTNEGEKKLTDTKSCITFSVNQSLLIDDQQYIRAYWLDQYNQGSSSKLDHAPIGLCSISGKTQTPLALTHDPGIKGVPDTQAFGAKIVSFDKDAFVSYGFKQSLGASTSVATASAYAAAINYMLRKDSFHSIKLVSSVCLFWTKDKNDDFIANCRNILDSPSADTVSHFLKSPWRDSIGHTCDLDRFYALILSGNSSRIIIRHWIDLTLTQAKDNIGIWFEDLQLHKIKSTFSNSEDNIKSNNKSTKASKKPKSTPLGIWNLACSTVRDSKELRSQVVDQLFLAALYQKAPSLSLLNDLLIRLKINVTKDGYKVVYRYYSLFALIKLIINRDSRIYSQNKEQTMEISSSLDHTSKDPGYLCGRLLAVLARAQQKAHNYSLSGSGVAERYFGMAMSSPQSVFPLLMKLNRHHLSKLDKTDPRGVVDDYIEKDIQNIVKELSDFPSTLDLKKQGRFALGYYHEQADFQAKIDEHREKKASDSAA